jgi:hypothetical protein
MMMKLTKILFLTSVMLLTSWVTAAPLISAKEAALPAASGALATRGISRGPSVKLVSPEADTPVSSPLDFKVNFEARGEGCLY